MQGAEYAPLTLRHALHSTPGVQATFQAVRKVSRMRNSSQCLLDGGGDDIIANTFLRRSKIHIVSNSSLAKESRGVIKVYKFRIVDI